MSHKPRGRDVWPWWKRAPVRFARGLFNIFIGPFLSKLPDGTIQGSMTRVAVAAFTVVECFRLLPQNGPGEMRIVPIVSWPETFLAFCILFALPLDAALTKAKPSEVLGFLRSPFSRGGEALDAGADVTTTLRQEITQPPDNPTEEPDAGSDARE